MHGDFLTYELPSKCAMFNGVDQKIFEKLSLKQREILKIRSVIEELDATWL